MRRFSKTILGITLGLSICAANATTVLAVDPLEPGISIAANTDYPDSDGNYQVSFVYEAASDITEVTLIGGFQFYTADQEEAYVNGEHIYYTSPFEYKDGMFPTGYAVSEYNYAPIAMDEVTDGTFELTIPLPGGQYFYGFGLTHENGDTEIVKDPTNLPFVNGDSDSGWSLFYVGNADDCISGQEYIFPRDGENGTVEYVNYPAYDGSSQPLGIYLPYGYDADKTYKTLYLSHGGGGNEVEWFNIGSGKNIMDNLIADGGVAETIVVTMDNSYFSFESGDSLINITDNIIPFIEANYSVSVDPKDRAMAGLSSGASVTVQALLYSNDTFGYYGVFSPSRTMDFVNETLTDDMKAAFPNAEQYYVSVGIFDSFVRRDVNVQAYEELMAAGANVVFEWKNGAHDWGVWRDQLSEFVNDYLWNPEPVEAPVVEEPTPEVEEQVETAPVVEEPVEQEADPTIVETGDNSLVGTSIGAIALALAAIGYLRATKQSI